MNPNRRELPEHLRLDASEARVLASLAEKETITPEQYPLTENALLLACNQKTSREPVMELRPSEVGHVLRRLEARGLVRSRHGARAQRWEHRLAEAYGLTRAQQAVLTVLMLRGPQTAAELMQRCERLHRFESIAALEHTLARLHQRDPALAVELPRAPGQREVRWAHTLCGLSALPSMAEPKPSPVEPAADDRIDALIERIALLEQRIEALEARCSGRTPMA